MTEGSTYPSQCSKEKFIKVLEMDWVEYLVFAATMIASLVVGLYFALTDPEKHTMAGYLFGGKQMGIFPVTVSLITSHISGVTLIGVPTEVYTYGTQYLISGLGYILVGLLTVYVFLPIFYHLQLVSLYQYLELRYDQTVRRLVSILFTIYMVFQTPLVAYGPAIILNQVSGVNVLMTALIITAVCIVYTTTGGLKAVVWADTLQGTVMLGSTIAVTAIGVWKVGGLEQVFEAAEQGDRLQLFLMDPDPRLRTSFWSCLIGVSTVITYLSGVHPSFVQRYIALPTFKKAKSAVIWYVIGCSILFFLSGFLGLVMYAKYKGCDPLTAGEIERADQILPYFLQDTAKDMPGLSGLFLAGMLSAALSTMSTNLNTASGTIYSDLVEPVIGKGSDARASWTMRFICALLGVVSLALLAVIDRLAAILELAYMVLGLSSGSIFGIFLLGLFFPQSNTVGCVGGAMTGLGVMSWIVVEARIAISSGQTVYEGKPVSLIDCKQNFTIPTARLRTDVEGVFPLFEISVFYYTTLGCLITVFVGVLLSYLSGGSRGRSVDRKLLSPLVRPAVPRGVYASIPLVSITQPNKH